MAEIPRNPCQKCPLDAVISVGETLIAGFEPDSKKYEVTGSVIKQVTLARFALDRLATRLDCQGPIIGEDNIPACPMPLNSFIAITEQRGPTVNLNGYPFDKEIVEASEQKVEQPQTPTDHRGQYL